MATDSTKPAPKRTRKAKEAAPARFWTLKQNNSGGFFDHDEENGVGYAICVEAADVAHAEARLKGIIDRYGASASCPCCGDRWSFWLDDDDGYPQPGMYGPDDPLRGSWGLPSYVHYLDGRIVEAPYKEAA